MEPQIEMNREKVKTVGFSLLAQSGQFSLEIDYIKAINTEETEGKGVYANIQLAKRNCFITIHTLKKNNNTGDWPRISKPKKEKEKAQIEAAS